MFWSKKRQQNEEHEKTIRRIITLEAELEGIKKKLDHHTGLVSSLRGLVNRKLGGKAIVDEELGEKPQDPFDDVRALGKENNLNRNPFGI